MDLMEAIKGRRSVRKYKPDLVSDQALQTLLEAVRWALPGEYQCSQVILVKDPSINRSCRRHFRRHPAVRRHERGTGCFGSLRDSKGSPAIIKGNQRRERGLVVV